MHHFNPALYEPEGNRFDSYCLTWYDSGYSGDGPCGELLQYTQEKGLNNESNSAYEDAADGFLSGSWYSEELADQVYDTVELPYNGGDNWIHEYETYFASYWGEEMVPHDYGYREYEYYNGSLEKADDTNDSGHQEGSYFSFSDSMEGAYNGNPWPGYHFDLVDGIENNYRIPGKPNQPPEKNNEDPWVHVGLWESIFGNWPCLQRLRQERPPDSLLTV